MYSKQIKLGGKCRNLKKSIVILFSDKNLKNMKTIEDYFTKWSIYKEMLRKGFTVE